MISGHTYSGVPIKVLVYYLGSKTFEIPKSAKWALPSQSNKIFSGFKSQYIIF